MGPWPNLIKDSHLLSLAKGLIYCAKKKTIKQTKHPQTPNIFNALAATKKQH